MKVELSDEALAYGDTVRRALDTAGGDELVRRDDLVVTVLAALGAGDLDPRGGGDEAEAAAALCRNAGWWALPYPATEQLAWPVDLDVDEAGQRDAALGLVLGCWTLLGMLDRAVVLTGDYVRERRQFGQPLASFQGVQFQLTEAEVERAGVEELAKHALWSVTTQPPHDGFADALALRLAAIEAAEVVFRIAHQLHGAIGFCDETTLSWLSRASQPLRRQPLGLSATRDRLVRHIGRRGLAGLFDELVAPG